MHADHVNHFKFTTRARLDKSINSLVGIVEGVAIDGAINHSEVSFLRMWFDEHVELQNCHPYTELVPVVSSAISDGVLTHEEREDILWLCERMASTEYYDQVTADLQRLHAVVGGIASDGIVTEAELRGLSAWLDDHEHLKSCWPYDEVASLVTAVLADGKISPQEQSMLRDFFSEFTSLLDDKTITSPSVKQGESLVGLCAVCPEIEFSGAKFCFTGASSKHKRSDLSALVQKLGGEVVGSLTSTVNYLVIGADGNPCWAYACYGRKVEKAVELRKAGARLLLVHENDFHDAVADRV
ncbi:BRCT domain-containing protein [Ramlibacter sp. WS9]|uniref:BRCT domain-containing protein n=1 Tax=Ramlibacter sp. WS9 TaxID=1882741 RepID=UPI0011443B7D|nr:NAD-dependent DNA ligase [Ramlibacter sp. WS9]